jgi:hypothetical protein
MRCCRNRSYFPRIWCVASSPEATCNLHQTQPRYFAQTCSEVVNLTGLLKTKD